MTLQTSSDARQQTNDDRRACNDEWRLQVCTAESFALAEESQNRRSWKHDAVQLFVRAFVKQRLTSHKVPRVFELRAELPRSATGKVLRHLLAETA